MIVDKVKEVAKAVAAGVVAAVAYLMGIVSSDATIGEALGSLTALQIFGLVLSIFAAYGFVWSVPNTEGTGLNV